MQKEKGSEDEGYKQEKDAEFEIYDSGNKKVKTIRTDENGIAVLELYYGKYRIRQVKGADGYAFIKDFEVDIKEDKEYSYNLKNEKESKLIFSKTDFSTKKPVPNTLIEIYTNSDKLVFKGRTDKNGKIEIDKLSIGKYYILEKDAPDYYILNKEKMPFEIKKNGSIVKCNMENHRKKGRIKVVKKDSLDDKELSDANIDIYFEEENKKVYSGTTDENGELKTGDLAVGKYCIYEIKAPDGYKRIKKPVCVELKDDDQELEVILKNNKYIYIPDTFLNQSKKSVLIVIFIVLSAIFIIVYETKSKKKS